MNGAAEIVKNIKSMVNEGNVAHVRVWNSHIDCVNIPVHDDNSRIRLGAVLPVWELLLYVIKESGPDCTVEVVLDDGSTRII